MSKNRKKIKKSKEIEKRNNYISLLEATRYCNYSQEYLSLRARQGKLKAKKDGRNWVTKKEWLKEYIAKVEKYKNLDFSRIKNLKNPKVKNKVSEKVIVRIKEQKEEQEEKQIEKQKPEEILPLEVPPLEVPPLEVPLVVESKPVKASFPKIRISSVLGILFFLIFILIFTVGFWERSSSSEAYNAGESGDMIISQAAGLVAHGFAAVSRETTDVSESVFLSVDIAQYSFRYTASVFNEYFQWLGKGINKILFKVKASASTSFKDFYQFITEVINPSFRKEVIEKMLIISLEMRE